MDVRIAEKRPRGKVAPSVRRIRRPFGKRLLGRCLIERAYICYGLLGGERWQSEAGNTGDKDNLEFLFHKFSGHNPKCIAFISVGCLPTMTQLSPSMSMCIKSRVRICVQPTDIAFGI